MPDNNLEIALGAILFVAAEPVPVERLAEATSSTVDTVTAALSNLQASMSNTGICLSVLDHKYRMVSSPQATQVVKKYMQAESNLELSKAALETLAIVAYRGPLTKSDIEAIRGVSSDTMLRNLLSRALIITAGKSSEPGKPELYTVSHTFLQHFGLTGLDELPELPEETE
jgi:segregation and condensation protein B